MATPPPHECDVRIVSIISTAIALAIVFCTVIMQIALPATSHNPPRLPGPTLDHNLVAGGGGCTNQDIEPAGSKS